jgi:hypothetical protein
MASGDINVKILYSQSLGGGFSLTGGAKNTKRLVVGEITGTYVSTGLAVNKLGGPAAFGLVTMDFLKVVPWTLNAAYPEQAKLFTADYDVTNQKIFCNDEIGAAGAGNDPADGEAVVLRFVAVGDDATAPEL